jgi:hypothetical protein
MRICDTGGREAAVSPRVTSSPLPRDISLSTDRRYALSSAKQIGNARTVAINMTNGSTPVMMTVEDIA